MILALSVFLLFALLIIGIVLLFVGNRVGLNFYSDTISNSHTKSDGDKIWEVGIACSVVSLVFLFLLIMIYR